MPPDRDRFVRAIGDEEAVNTAIILTVAADTGTPPAALDLDKRAAIEYFNDAVDPDAIDSLFRRSVDGRVSFYWAECEIEIDGGDRVAVRSLD